MKILLDHSRTCVTRSRRECNMVRTAIKILKLIYLLMLCVGLTSAITYGMYLALDVFFAVLDQANVFRITFYFLFPIFRYAYTFCILVAYPMLATIHKCEQACNNGTGKKPTKYIILAILENVLGGIVAAVLIYIIDPMFVIYIFKIYPVPYLWAWELPTIVLFIIFAMKLPSIAGTINEDKQELHLFGYHVHESMFGVIYIFAALLLVFNARVSVIDLIFASLFFVFGGFLFGRDIKDVMAGKFIEKLKPQEGSS